MTEPMVSVVFYRDDDGSCPLLDWLDSLPRKAQDKCVVRIERLRELGHGLRRPEADYLRDGIYELRAKHSGINYPPKEIELAIRRKRRFAADPEQHTYEENS